MMRRLSVLKFFGSHIKFNAWRNIDIIVSQKKSVFVFSLKFFQICPSTL